MPCNLAVSITKAVVMHSSLCVLLTPAVLEHVIGSFLDEAYSVFDPHVRRTPLGVTCSVGTVTFAVMQATITMRAGVRTALAEQLLPQLERLISRTVDVLCVHCIYDVLVQRGQVSIQTVDVVTAMAVLPATVLTTRSYGSDGVDVRVVVLPGGALQIFVDGDISFETAWVLTRDVLLQFRVRGLLVEQSGAIEQHKEGVDHVHVVAVTEHIHDDS